MLKHEDVLFIPKPARLLHDSSEEDGQRVLTLFYNEKEITFDDPELIPFGERLLQEKRFVAEQTCAWKDTGYAWETVAELLETLVEEGVLQIEGVAPPAFQMPVFTDAGSVADARAWTPESCVALSTEIFKWPVEAGNLESLIRGTRIAHPALDRGARQIGEANVFPVELRLDLPTTRKACPFSGSRHEHELPMNMTGLEPVQKCWRGVLQDLEVVKADYFRRRPAALRGLTVRDLYVLASAILSMPAFMMFRAENRIANGELPIEISSLFRVIDGTRITTRDMLLTANRQFEQDIVPEPERFFHYADREMLLISDRGVCAGPPKMIEAFLESVMKIDPQNAPKTMSEASRLGDVVPAMDYGIVACELECRVDQFWLRQGRIVDDLIESLDESETAWLARLRLIRSPEAIAYQFVEEFVSRPAVYDNFSRIIERCHEVRGRAGAPILPPFEAEPRGLEAMTAMLAPHFAASSLPAFARAAAQLQVIEEEAFPRMAERQSECNAILGRPAPSHPYGARDLAGAWAPVSLRAAFAENGIELDGG